ncbi:Protein artichoke [Gryllus bimaculatus]|nr:Protein artichoke [Gryllus bimaculatus]
MLRFVPPLLLWAFFALLSSQPVRGGYEPPGPRYRCPTPPSQYHPCSCFPGEDGLHIKCENANLAILSTAFYNIAATRAPIELLELERCHFERLYGALLQPLLVRVLRVSDTPLRRVEADAFAGTQINNLTELRVVGHNITTLPRDAFSGGKVAEHLVKLTLSEGPLTALAPAALAPLRRLKRLDVSYNNISSLQRAQFKGLRDCEVLDLSHNGLEKVEAAHFGDLTRLLFLNLSHNHLSNLPRSTFARNSLLLVLNLTSNALPKIDVTTFRGMRSIRRLYLAYNRISDVARGAFDSLTRVGTIDLEGNRLTTRIHLARNNITSVEAGAFKEIVYAHIDLSHNAIKKIPAGTFIQCTNLTRLDLSHNLLTGITKRALDELSYPGELDLSFNNISDFTQDVARGALTRLSSLRAISVRHNNVSKPFTPPPSLAHLDLSYNSFKGLPERTAWPTMNALLSLDFSHNQITNEGLPRGCLSNLLTLQSLEFANNSITHPPREALTDLTSLQYIGLRNNKLHRLERGAFGRLPVVFTLDLSQNMINNISERAFDGLLQLQTLNLTSNNLTRIPNGAFQGLVSLRTLDISKNKLNSLDNGTNSLLEDCLSLENLNLSYNDMFVLSKRSLPSSPWVPYKLNNLDLSYNRLPVLTAEFLPGGRRLERLSLASNLLSELRPGVLGNLTNLRYLDISSNLLKVFPGPMLGPPPNLTELRIASNRLITLPTKELASLKFTLKLLDVAGNRLSGTPVELIPQLLNGTIMKFEGNPLQCDCRIRPILRWFSEKGSVPEEWSNVRCSEPDHLAGLAIPEVPEPRLSCSDKPISVLPSTGIPEDNGIEYDPAPDVRFRKVQRFENGSISASWYVWTRSDVADFLLLARPVSESGTSTSNVPLAEVDLSYIERRAILPIPANAQNPLQFCVATRNSLGELRPLRPRHQCRVLSEGSGSIKIQSTLIGMLISAFVYLWL